jgi:putative transposon-encoded protein
MDITIKDAYQVIEKVVSRGGNSGRVYVASEWVGKRVKIVLVDPINHDTKVLRNDAPDTTNTE